jgi:hypothetical protein
MFHSVRRVTDDRFYCCRGYCIDLLKELASRNNFTYSLALSPDGQFGHFAFKNGSGESTNIRLAPHCPLAISWAHIEPLRCLLINIHLFKGKIHEAFNSIILMKMLFKLTELFQ